MSLARLLGLARAPGGAALQAENSLIIQSLHSRLGAEATNGDGFGVGWYGHARRPGVFRSTEPAWNDRNLRDLAAHIDSPLVLRTHPSVDRHRRCSRRTAIRSATGGGCGCTTGSSTGSDAMKRDLVLAVDPDLYPAIEGSTDSEMFFFLALTFGLEEDPPAARGPRGWLHRGDAERRMASAFPMQMTVATTDGETTWAFRYSSEGRSRSLFHSTDVSTLRHQYPDNPVLHELSDDARLVVSEPLGDLRGAWREVPESTFLTVKKGTETLQSFQPA